MGVPSPPSGGREAIVSMEINAITFVVTDMATSVGFYTDLGGEIVYGGADAPFTSLSFGSLKSTAKYGASSWMSGPPGSMSAGKLK